MKRANDAEAAKAFLSRRSDSMRPAYGRKVVEFLRHNVFAATTNETNFLQGDNGNRRWWIVTVNGNGHVSTWLPKLQSMVNQLWAEAYTYYKMGTKLYLSPELEAEANTVQLNHSSIHNDPILDDIRLYLERMVPRAYSTWSIPMRAAYQKGAYTESSPDGKPEVLLNMVCPRQIIEELPNDLVRRNPAKYTAQYINRLMSLVDGWERSEQEKVKGLHPAYCDKTGRAKHPWVRVGNATQGLIEGKEESIEPELPF